LTFKSSEVAFPRVKSDLRLNLTLSTQAAIAVEPQAIGDDVLDANSL
jgi:hypothetical protein